MANCVLNRTCGDMLCQAIASGRSPVSAALGGWAAVDAQRLEFWKAFLVDHIGFPHPERLAAQLAAASFSGFCNCGCNSFATTVPAVAGLDPLSLPGKSNVAIFQSSLRLEPSGKSLEIMLFSDERGNLSFVEIDCNANSEPVPATIQVKEAPYHVHAEQGLAP